MRFMLLAAASCIVAAAAQQPAATWRTDRRTAGDTSIVRTVGAPPAAGLRRLTRVMSFGSADGADEYIFGAISDLRRAPDGSLWVFDAQVPILRRYDSTGKYLGAVGRSGQGPGEYTGSNGLAFLPNGNAILWDRGTLRLRVYSAAGQPAGDWSIPGFQGSSQMSFSTSNGVRVDTAGFAYVSRYMLQRPSPGSPLSSSQSQTILFRFSQNGNVDTMPTPVWPSLIPPPPAVVVTVGSSSSSVIAPFHPTGITAWSPYGDQLVARTDIYAIHVLKRGGRVLRIEREMEPIRITTEQKQDAINDIELRMRRMAANWNYDGPPVPDVLPRLNAMEVDLDGRIWVRAASPLRRLTDAEREQAAVATPPGAAMTGRAGAGGGGGGGGPGMPPPVNNLRFVSDYVYDVYAPDGRFLGRVPWVARTSPRVMQGDYIWGVMVDSLGVQSVAKFRIDPPLR